MSRLIFHTDIQLLYTFVEKTFSHLIAGGPLLKMNDHIHILVCFCILLFHLKYLSILPLVPHLLKVLICSSVNVPHVLLKDCFRCLSAFHFCLNFRMSLLTVKKKKFTRLLIEIALTAEQI